MKTTVIKIKSEDITCEEQTAAIKKRNDGLASADNQVSNTKLQFEKAKDEAHKKFDVEIQELLKKRMDPDIMEIEVEKIKLSEKQRLLQITKQWEKKIEDSEQLREATVDRIMDIEITLPNVSKEFNVIIENEIFSTETWCDIKVKARDSVYPLSQVAEYWIKEGKLEMIFQSMSPRQVIRVDAYIQDHQNVYTYSGVDNPEGMELIIVTL